LELAARAAARPPLPPPRTRKSTSLLIGAILNELLENCRDIEASLPEIVLGDCTVALTNVGIAIIEVLEHSSTPLEKIQDLVEGRMPCSYSQRECMITQGPSRCCFVLSSTGCIQHSKSASQAAVLKLLSAGDELITVAQPRFS
jgi:hypothetical protein